MSARITDPRYLRSRALLNGAIWRLSALKAPTLISVAELCREAGVTRDTFYRHANSPVELLSSAVTKCVQEIAERAQATSPAGSSVVSYGMLLLMTHMAEHAAVYRHGTDPDTGAALQPALESVFTSLLRASTENFNNALPNMLQQNDLGRSMAVSYAAAGAVGAIRVWLHSGSQDPRQAAEFIVVASPQFWLFNEGSA